MNVKRTPFQLFFLIAAFCLGFAIVMLLFYDQILGNSLSLVLTAPGRTPSFSETLFTAIGGRWITFAAFASGSLFFCQHGLTTRNAARRDVPTPLGLPDQDLTARVQLALDYTDEDLQANRAGLLSPNQAEQYGALQASTDQVLFNLGARALIIIGGALFVFWTTKAGLSLIATATTDTGRLVENIISGILPLILIALVLFRIVRANSGPPKVKLVVGKVRLSMWDVAGIRTVTPHRCTGCGSSANAFI